MSLCDSCRFVQRMERAGGSIHRICNVEPNPLHIPGDIVKCSTYENKNTPQKYEMEAIAWILRPNTSSKIFGFEPPKKEK